MSKRIKRIYIPEANACGVLIPQDLYVRLFPYRKNFKSYGTIVEDGDITGIIDYIPDDAKYYFVTHKEIFNCLIKKYDCTEDTFVIPYRYKDDVIMDKLIESFSKGRRVSMFILNKKVKDKYNKIYNSYKDAKSISDVEKSFNVSDKISINDIKKSFDLIDEICNKPYKISKMEIKEYTTSYSEEDIEEILNKDIEKTISNDVTNILDNGIYERAHKKFDSVMDGLVYTPGMVTYDIYKNDDALIDKIDSILTDFSNTEIPVINGESWKKPVILYLDTDDNINMILGDVSSRPNVNLNIVKTTGVVRIDSLKRFVKDAPTIDPYSEKLIAVIIDNPDNIYPTIEIEQQEENYTEWLYDQLGHIASENGIMISYLINQHVKKRPIKLHASTPTCVLCKEDDAKEELESMLDWCVKQLNETIPHRQSHAILYFNSVTDNDGNYHTVNDDIYMSLLKQRIERDDILDKIAITKDRNVSLEDLPDYIKYMENLYAIDIIGVCYDFIGSFFIPNFDYVRDAESRTREINDVVHNIRKTAIKCDIPIMCGLYEKKWEHYKL